MKNAQSKFAQTLGTMYQSRNRLLLTGTPLQVAVENCGDEMLTGNILLLLAGDVVVLVLVYVRLTF